MKPSEILDQDVASESSLFGKVIFLIATPGTGAEVLVRALGELPGVATMPTQTLLFSQGLHRVLEHWWEDRTAQGRTVLSTSSSSSSPLGYWPMSRWRQRATRSAATTSSSTRWTTS